MEYIKFSKDYVTHKRFKNKTYYFSSRDREELYKELIAEEIAKELNIPCVHYEPALSGLIVGVISESFYKYGTCTVSLKEILEEGLGKEYDPMENSLYNIWDSLDKRYGRYTNGSLIVQRLMRKIIEVFVFDILIMNVDRHDENLFIREGRQVDLAPIIDNEYSFSCSIASNSNYIVATEDAKLYLEKYPKVTTTYANAERFLYESSSEFTAIFEDYLETLTPSKLSSIIGIMEEKRNMRVPEEIKQEILVIYKEHYKNLQKILEQYKKTINRQL